MVQEADHVAIDAHGASLFGFMLRFHIKIASTPDSKWVEAIFAVIYGTAPPC